MPGISVLTAQIPALNYADYDGTGAAFDCSQFPSCAVAPCWPVNAPLVLLVTLVLAMAELALVTLVPAAVELVLVTLVLAVAELVLVTLVLAAVAP